MDEKYYTSSAAKERAEELTKKAHDDLIASHPLEKKIDSYFKGKLGSDELLHELNVSDEYDYDDTKGNDKTDGRFKQNDLDYTLISTEEEYDRYIWGKVGTERDTVTSSYSGTISSDGHVSLSPDMSTVESNVYGVYRGSDGKETFSGYYKVLKKKDVEEVEKAEQEIWRNRQRYKDVAYANGKVSEWKEVSPVAFFFKYGLAPFVLIIMMAFAALLLPRFNLSFPWMSEEPPYFWTFLRRTRLYTLSPYIAVAALGVAMVSAILLLVIKSKVNYRFMYDRYMKWYKWFFWRMFAAACCVLLAFLLGMIPEKTNADGVIAELILGLVKWIGIALANISWIAAFVLLIINLWAIVRRGFGIALAIDINDRVWDLQSYVEQGEYAKDEELIKKIKSYTVKKTAKAFDVPQDIDLTYYKIDE